MVHIKFVLKNASMVPLLLALPMVLSLEQPFNAGNPW